MKPAGIKRSLNEAIDLLTYDSYQIKNFTRIQKLYIKTNVEIGGEVLHKETLNCIFDAILNWHDRHMLFNSDRMFTVDGFKCCFLMEKSSVLHQQMRILFYGSFS